jgi:hypothetical protein
MSIDILIVGFNLREMSKTCVIFLADCIGWFDIFDGWCHVRDGGVSNLSNS